MASAVPYVEHHITHGGHMIYAREYPGQDPAYVMMHGFPDNLHIYDYVVPYLTQASRRVVVFDFLGFGQSEKVTQKNYPYTFEQQVGDLAAVADALKLNKSSFRLVTTLVAPAPSTIRLTIIGLPGFA